MTNPPPDFDPDESITFAPIRDEDVAPTPAAGDPSDPNDLADDPVFTTESVKPRRGGRVVAALLLGLGVLLGGLYYAAGVYAGDKVPPGTTVRGVGIGGLRPAAAEAKLTDELGAKVHTQIKVSIDDRESSLDPTRAGLTLDAPGTVVAAGGVKSWAPARLWSYFTGGGAVDPAVRVDDAAFTATLSELSKGIADQPVDGGITFKPTKDSVEAVRTEPETGQGVDPEHAKARLVKAFLTPGPVELNTVELEPTITKAAVDQAMTEFAEPALSGPVTLMLGKAPVVVKPRAYTRAITMVAQDQKLVPKLDTARLLKAMKPAMRGIGDTPEDARIVIRNGKPVVIPAKVGVTFEKAALTQNFLDLVVAQDGQRTKKFKVANSQPEFTTADAKKLGVKRRVSTFTTYFPYAEYRNVNLPRAASLINGTLLKPGETFSLNGIVGERTAANGFVEGYTIQNGIFKKDFGGGVSQIATTTFNAMFFAGLQDVEHKAHSVFIDRYPVGREATVVWGALDLKFKNTTPYGVLIEAHVTRATPTSSGVATVSMYSTKYWDIKARTGARYAFVPAGEKTLTDDDCEPASGIGGFSIDVWRDFYRAGSSSRTRTEKFHTVYKPSPTVKCKPPEEPKKKP